MVTPKVLGEILDEDWPCFAQALFHERAACRILGINAEEVFQKQFIVEKKLFETEV